MAVLGSIGLNSQEIKTKSDHFEISMGLRKGRYAVHESLNSLDIKYVHQPIERAGNWGYLAGSWREAIKYFIDILVNI